MVYLMSERKLGQACSLSFRRRLPLILPGGRGGSWPNWYSGKGHGSPGLDRLSIFWVLWPQKIEDKGHGLPICNEQGHGYLLCKRGHGSLFTFGKDMSFSLARLYRRVTAYPFVASRVTAHLVCEGWLREALYIWERSVLWPHQVEKTPQSLNREKPNIIFFSGGVGRIDPSSSCDWFLDSS